MGRTGKASWKVHKLTWILFVSCLLCINNLTSVEANDEETTAAAKPEVDSTAGGAVTAVPDEEARQVDNNDHKTKHKHHQHSSRKGGQKRRKGDGIIGTTSSSGSTTTTEPAVPPRKHGVSPSPSSSSDLFENPLFPPRTDGFWKQESSLRASHHQKSRGAGKRNNKGPHSEAGRSRRPPKVKTSKMTTTSSQPKAQDEDENKEDDRPNIILMITDDQDVELGSLDYMPETLKEFRENGIEFRHGYVTTPMCCPSRSSMLTGLYVHNHEVFTNNDNCSSVAWRHKYEKKTFAYHLWKSGYYTSYIGKYLNKYDGSHIPAGWDEWNGLLMNSKFYNYTVNRNGEKYRHGNVYEYDYYPDVITNDTLEFLDRSSRRQYLNFMSPNYDSTSETPLPEGGDPTPDGYAEGSESEDYFFTRKKRRGTATAAKRKPFLLVVSYPSPHGPEDSAPQYSQMFFNATPHHTPSYNHAPNSDKQWILRNTDKMTSQLKSFTNLLMTKRLQTLQSVDFGVREIFDKLQETRLLDNTFIFYTSDHGYHVGQFGLIKGKSMPYEFDIRVPYFVRVPPSYSPKEVVVEETRKQVLITEPVLNIDLAPTFLDIGKVAVPTTMDGRSFLPLVDRYIDGVNVTGLDDSWGHTWLVESSGRRENVANQDLGDGRSRKKHKPSKKPKLDLEIYDEDDTLKQLCLLHPHPCLPKQKKYCKVEKNHIRFRKCRVGQDFALPFAFPMDLNTTSAVCRCNRDRRSADSSGSGPVWSWDDERQKIDQEIEDLKTRIENLREAKRKMKMEWETSMLNATSKVPKKPKNEASRRLEQAPSSGLPVSVFGTPVQTEEGIPVEMPDEDDYSHPFHKSEEVEDDEDDTEDDDDDEDILDEYDDHDGHHTMKVNKPKSSSLPRRSESSQQGRSRSHKNRHRNRDHFPVVQVFENMTDDGSDCRCEIGAKSMRKIEREERKRKKMISKIRKKQKFLHRIGDPDTRAMAETCGTEEKMNCFWHDSDHWRTPPLWTDGSFCFCMNANNNSFTCLRSVNSTHNYLYCQFVTGFKMYFDLQKDPYELQNIIHSVQPHHEAWMVNQLNLLKSCKGQKQCWPQVKDPKAGIDSEFQESRRSWSKRKGTRGNTHHGRRKPV